MAGKARGAWFFEATFPVRLLDGNGREIADWVPAHAKADWMTDAWVPFETTLAFDAGFQTGDTIPQTRSGRKLHGKQMYQLAPAGKRSGLAG
ncbi:MAG: Gmad2 immunoglobulin-like domain-containing protein, partial [Syntrophobacterales bacterium]|nr:Gmad2 immunoglobulin-like domain-containing protein [Syntrophobacterales bacterium]